MNKKVLIVDDDIINLQQISSYLADTYTTVCAQSGEDALIICRRDPPDIILLDIKMPKMNGFETLEHLRRSVFLRRIPVIFMTAAYDAQTEVQGLKSGARDFIRKPINPGILLHRIKLHIRFASYEAHLEKVAAELSGAIATGCAELIECRDENTGEHVVRTGKIVRILGQEMVGRSEFKNLTQSALDLIVSAAPLHDIGKIAVSDTVLLKPGRLDDAEFELMKQHASTGAAILQTMYERTPAQTYLQYAVKIAATHHEKYDGSGYPYGIAGDEIPLCGRIMAIADVYDALVDSRVYRTAMSHEEACGIILAERGKHFDPKIVEIFDAHKTEIAVEAVKQKISI